MGAITQRFSVKVRALPLSVKMLVTTLGLALVPLIVTGYVAERTAGEVLLDEKREDLRVHAQEATTGLDRIIRTRLAEISDVAKGSAVGNFMADRNNSESIDKMTSALKSFTVMHGNIKSMFFVDTATGTVLASTANNQGAKMGLRHFIKNAASGQAAVSAPSRDGGQDLIYYAAPVAGFTGAIEGVVVLATDASELWNQVDGEHDQLGKGNIAVLTDEYGVRIAHSDDHGLIYRSWAPLPEETEKKLISEQHYGADITDIGATDNKEIVAVITGQDPPENINEHQLSITDELYESGVSRASLAPWTLMDSVPRSSFMSSVEVLEGRSELITGISIMFIAAVTLFASRFSSKPIRKLLLSVENMAQGDMDTPVPVIADRELGSLAQSFNTMRQHVVRSRADLERGHIDPAKALVASLETRDPYTGGHAERVGQYALLLSRRLNLPEKEIARIKRAADLHDVGKIGVPDSILLKPGKLTPAEFTEIRRHPVRSGEIIHYLGFLRDIVPYVEGHHESYDGTGYPRGLKGESIPLGARILAVADAYDAMTSKRAYRGAMEHQQAMDIICRGAGAQWDPEVAAAFIEAMEESGSSRFAA